MEQVEEEGREPTQLLQVEGEKRLDLFYLFILFFLWPVQLKQGVFDETNLVHCQNNTSIYQIWKCPKYTAFKTTFAKLKKIIIISVQTRTGQTRTTGPQINATQPAISPVPSI